MALALVYATAGYAQLQRLLPAEGKLGELVGQQHPLPLLQIDDQVRRLAPGARIFDQDNRTIVHGALPERASVLFVEDTAGDVARVYILLPTELERLQSSGGR